MNFKNLKNNEGFSLTELLVVLVIIGILVLLALPRLMPVVTKAKTVEAKLNLKQVYILEQSYKFEHDTYSLNFSDIGFEQEKLIKDGGTARYVIKIEKADQTTFTASATSTIDFSNKGTFNVWQVDESGIIKEITPE
jgi:type IV pilus assembly protein PilE